jgi:glycosyltransferase involved in cell wall biosynthesis
VRNKKNNNNISVFIGNYLDGNIQIERGLLAPNPAGSNRMWRLSRAIQTMGFSSYIISPACSARIKFNTKIIHPTRITRKSGVVIIYAPALAIPYFSILFEFFSMTWVFLRLSFLRKVRITMLYCYYPSTIIVGIIAKIQKIKIIEDLEDIVTPKLSDWFHKPLMFSLQQTIGGFLMKISLWLSDLVIIPSSKFKFKTIENKNYLVIDGCIDVVGDIQTSFEDEKITVLLAGMLDEEQGIGLYLRTLEIINKNEELAKRFKFNISGLSLNEEELKTHLSTFINLDLTYYGFVSSAEFDNILKKANVCLVLQNPSGRNAQQKTPSKGYEYMASGKAVIVTPIGDYVMLPEDTCFLLNDYTPENIIAILNELNNNTIIEVGSAAKQFAKENWGFENVGRRIIKSLF